jgi:hypothetical protein
MSLFPLGNVLLNLEEVACIRFDREKNSACIRYIKPSEDVANRLTFIQITPEEFDRVAADLRRRVDAGAGVQAN